ncbi:MAG: FHA domain-containing protein [Planctomycetaceae bacterium]|nr:FHA domain-containing protein [Planctomycetaceae bacterium]
MTVESGELAGRKTWMQSGGELTIGRTAYADFTVAHDLKMSGVHFTLTCDDKTCRVTDRNSTNGTFVNRKLVTETAVQNGDKIMAGETTFGVVIEDIAEPIALPDSAGVSVDSMSVGSVTGLGPLAKTVEYEHAAIDLPHTNGPGDVSPADNKVPSVPSHSAASPPLPPSVDPSTESAAGVTRAILRFSDGTGERKAWLHPGQTVTFGRTQRADYTVANDQLISGLHFALDCQPSMCRVRDLGGQNGTIVNGFYVTEATVYDGDMIQAGQTLFSLRVEGGPTAPNPQVRFAGIPARGKSTRSATMRIATYTQEECYSGVTVFRSTENEASGVDLAQQLARLIPLFLLVDRASIEQELPPDSADCEYLLDWLSEDTAKLCSPLVCSVNDPATCATLLEPAWSCNAAVCLFATTGKAELLGRLRRMARYDAPDAMAPADESAMLALYHPRILSALLQSGTKEFVDEFLSGVEAVLLESASGESWELFAESRFAETLQKLGYTRSERAEA